MTFNEIDAMEVMDALKGVPEDWRLIRKWIAQHGGIATHREIYDCFKAIGKNPTRPYLTTNMPDIDYCMEQMHCQGLLCTTTPAACPHGNWRWWCEETDCPRYEWMCLERDNLVASLHPLPSCKLHGRGRWIKKQ